MHLLRMKSRRLRLLAALLTISVLCVYGRSQESPKQRQQKEEVIRVNTDLVQTDLTVIDKRGRFASGLKADQFELRIDSQPQPLLFFEQVTVDSPVTATTGSDTTDKLVDGAAPSVRVGSGTPHGRLVFFFVDDVHLTGESTARARSLLTKFVDNQMQPNDQVAIVSSSGQIGFLQQLTNNKAVLREAISRLKTQYNPETIASHVTISEVDANLVANHGARGLFAYLVEATVKEFQMKNPLNAVNIIRNRVRQINAQSAYAEHITLTGLENLIRSTRPLPGRKVVFLVSDGFVVDGKRSTSLEVMRRLYDEAARVAAVIYSLDTRANYFDSVADVSKSDYPDFSPRAAGRSFFESKMPQEPLETLADETGGRSYLNSRRLEEGVAEALSENSGYYLLAWRPNTENQRAGDPRIQVSIKDRPDLRVRMRRHHFDLKSAQVSKPNNSEANGPNAHSPDDELRVALGALYPQRALPTAVSVKASAGSDKNTALTMTMQLDAAALAFTSINGKTQAQVDVLGVALDDRGQFANFKQVLNIPREVIAAQDKRFVTWTKTVLLPPGLYQVRVATRDRQSGRTGSAMTWIEIPK
jgi:VWFA-related protein